MRSDRDRRKSLFFTKTAEKPGQLIARPGIKPRNTFAAAARGEGGMSRKSSAVQNATDSNVVAAMTIAGFASLRSRVQSPIVFEVRTGEMGGRGVLRHKKKIAPREEPPSRARLKEEVKRF